jgi:two-component system, cell cycle response regulator
VIEQHPPQSSVLIACLDRLMSRSLESVFQQHGFVVERTESGARALNFARRTEHDVVVLVEGLQDLAAIDVCRALRDDPLFDSATPIVITSASPITPESRFATYSAGAWEYCSQPLDLDTLFLKLGTFLRARKDLELAQSKCLMDPESGLYTPFGLQQVAEQLGARAARKHEAFACVAFSPEETRVRTTGELAARGTGSEFAEVASLFRAQARKSDIVGHMGGSRLAILAPDTDGTAARQLVERLQRHLDASSENDSGSARLRLRAGYCAVSDFAAANFNPAELVHRAESALDRIPTDSTSEPILAYEDLPTA